MKQNASELQSLLEKASSFLSYCVKKKPNIFVLDIKNNKQIKRNKVFCEYAYIKYYKYRLQKMFQFYLIAKIVLRV